MKLFKVTIGAASYVVAAESSEEILAHTTADEVQEIDGTNCVPVSVSDLPFVAPNIVTLPSSHDSTAIVTITTDGEHSQN